MHVIGAGHSDNAASRMLDTIRHGAFDCVLHEADRANGLARDMMNHQLLPSQHGAPLRLRVEHQLGFKMVKWNKAIEFVEDFRSINKGEGGYAEDHEYFGELASI